MKTLSFLIASFCLLGSTAFSNPPNLVDIAVKNSDFSTLVTALKAADLVEAVRDGEFTIFAPTDAAFAKVPKDVLGDLLKPENKKQLQAVLLYHAVPGKGQNLASLLAKKSLTTAEGNDLTVAFAEGRVKVNDANLAASDIQAENGVIHVIDSVLLPPAKSLGKPGSLLATAESAGSFNTLLAAVNAAGLVDALNGDGPLTVFAPTDAAFAALPKGTVESLLEPESKDKLIDILTYHVVKGNVKAGDALNAGEATALNGQSLAFTFKDGDLKVDASKILTVNIAANNGIIHVIDSVLLPPTRQKASANQAGALKIIEIAIEHGVPIFNSGDKSGCVTVYLHATRKLLHEFDLPETAKAELEEGISDMSEAWSSHRKAWALRRGLDKAYISLKRADESEEAAAKQATSGTKTPVRVLLDFNGKDAAKGWKTVNDNVMGGRSKGGPSFGEGRLKFSGATNTNGGGFSSIRTEQRDWNADGAVGIVCRVKGDGRTYKFDLHRKGDTRYIPVAHRAEFNTTPGEWMDVRLPFSAFKATQMGRPVSAKQMDAESFGTVGFMIYDKKDGPFSLEVDWIGVYGGTDNTNL